ncbi:MAG: elongation factor G [bacterium]|nr:elongation factor G [bacterium]
MSIDRKTVRNIGIAAHIDAGKTTTTERILFYTGATHAPGEVDLATTQTDFDPQEQNRGITIYSAAVSCPWKGYNINLIDTPGHVDFTAEVERCLRVLDAAVVVFDAKEGAEPQSETVWRQADKYNVPRICLINKMDKLGADFRASVESMVDRLEAHPAVLQLPIGAENGFEGVVDLLTMQARHYDPDSRGLKFEDRDIPADMTDQAAEWRHRLEEQLAEHDDRIMERFLEEEPIPVDDLKAAIREATIAGRLQPVLCGSSLKFVGVQALLDAVCDYCPCPLDVPPVTGTIAGGKDDGREIEVPPDPDGPLVGLVFKVVAAKPVDLYFVRVYSGRLRANSRVFNAANGAKENISRMFRMFAKRRDQIDQAEAGDIVALIGPKRALTGHTLCDPQKPVCLESIDFPDTVISQSIEPRSSRDRDKLADALAALARQDPTFRVRSDPETGQTLIDGMGELHLEVLVHRLAAEMNLEVRVGKPRASYRETITRAAQGRACFDRQAGGRNHFAEVKLAVEPLATGGTGTETVFASALPEAAIDGQYLPQIEAGIADAAASGPRGGYAVVGFKATLVAARQHDSDSSELAFEAAAGMAFSEALHQAGPVLLEPIMKAEIHTPDAYFGAISGDLNARRAVIRSSEIRGRHRVIEAEVPLSELFGYVTRLRSMSQGRASAAMTPSHYAAVPESIAEKLVGSA